MPYQSKKNISVKKYNRVKAKGELIAVYRRNKDYTIQCLPAVLYRDRVYIEEKLWVGEERLLPVWYSYDTKSLQFYKNWVMLPIKATKFI